MGLGTTSLPHERRRRRAALRSDLRRAHPHSGPRGSRLRGARGARGGREAPPAPLLPFFEGSSHERQAARPDPRGARLQDGRAGARDHRQGVRSAGEDPHTPAPARADTLTTNTLWADSLKLLARGSESVRSRGKVSAPWQSLGPFLGDFCDSVRCTWHCDWSAMPSSRDQSPTVCARLPEASKSGSEGKRALESPSPCALARRSTRAPPSRRRGCAQTVPRLPPSAPGGAKVSEARVQHPRA